MLAASYLPLEILIDKLVAQLQLIKIGNFQRMSNIRTVKYQLWKYQSQSPSVL